MASESLQLTRQTPGQTGGNQEHKLNFSLASCSSRHGQRHLHRRRHCRCRCWTLRAVAVAVDTNSHSLTAKMVAVKWCWLSSSYRREWCCSCDASLLFSCFSNSSDLLDVLCKWLVGKQGGRSKQQAARSKSKVFRSLGQLVLLAVGVMQCKVYFASVSCKCIL